MNAHKNARLTHFSRELMIERIRKQGWTVVQAAEAAGVSERTAYKWLARYRGGGAAALHNARPVPRRLAHRLPQSQIASIESLRRQRLSGPAIARRLCLPRSTVGAVLRRCGLGRLKNLEEQLPPRRYERKAPGELIHFDTKKLGRILRAGHRITGSRTGRTRPGAGWEALHIAIDDATRLAYSEVLPDEKKQTAIAFLSRSLAFFKANGVIPERVMTDNGSAYRSAAFRDALGTAGLRHIRTRPYTPRTNGKAERFIQTSLREWAYAAPYQTSDERAKAMIPFINAYNIERPHSALAFQTPWQRLNNLLGNDT
ncbi:MAG: IS481 family transposase [Rhodomicrobium sp.]